MKIIICILAGVMGLVSVSNAQTNTVSGSSSAGTSGLEQTAAARRQFMESASGKELRAAVMAAEKEYTATASGIPAIADIEKQLEQLMSQVRDLRIKEHDLEKSSSVLQEKRAAIDAAIKALRDAMTQAAK